MSEMRKLLLTSVSSFVLLAVVSVTVGQMYRDTVEHVIRAWGG